MLARRRPNSKGDVLRTGQAPIAGERLSRSLGSMTVLLALLGLGSAFGDPPPCEACLVLPIPADARNVERDPYPNMGMHTTFVLHRKFPNDRYIEDVAAALGEGWRRCGGDETWHVQSCRSPHEEACGESHFRVGYWYEPKTRRALFLLVEYLWTIDDQGRVDRNATQHVDAWQETLTGEPTSLRDLNCDPAVSVPPLVFPIPKNARKVSPEMYPPYADDRMHARFFLHRESPDSSYVDELDAALGDDWHRCAGYDAWQPDVDPWDPTFRGEAWRFHGPSWYNVKTRQVVFLAMEYYALFDANGAKRQGGLQQVDVRVEPVRDGRTSQGRLDCGSRGPTDRHPGESTTPPTTQRRDDRAITGSRPPR